MVLYDIIVIWKVWENVSLSKKESKNVEDRDKEQKNIGKFLGIRCLGKIKYRY